MADTVHRTGILLVNVGTPDAPEPAAVRRYLRQFLSDPRVIDINPVGRALLLYLVILPFRPKRSAAAYQKIWSDEGSPLLVHGLALVQALRERFPDHRIELGMRYGQPSIEAALERLETQGCDNLLVMPLYPHYASSSTGSALEAVYANVARRWNTPNLNVVPPFYDHPAFISAFAELGQQVLAEFEADHLLFSFHGLPERQVIASADPKLCLASPDCCAELVEGNRNCYRAQCYASARELATALGLGEEHGQDQRWSVSFQSRLGRTPWIKPYTDEVLIELGQRGVQRLAVYCPAFVADCLETLEEIGIRAQQSFVAAGGQELRLIPSLNSNASWIDAVETMLRECMHQPRVSAASS